MFRGNGTTAAGNAANAPPAASSSSAASTMMRMLGMGKSNASAAASPAAPAPLDLPNPVVTSPTAAAASVFEVDEQLTELQRVKRYSLSQLPLQRLVYVKRLASCARAVGLKEALGQLLPLFSKLANDQEAVVRSATAAELANIAHFLADPHVPYHSHPPPPVLPSVTTTCNKQQRTQFWMRFHAAVIKLQ
jgi:hypothetical protein